MSIVSLFRRQPEAPDYAPPPMAPRVVEPEPEHTPIEWGEKPAELERAAEVKDWSRPFVAQPPPPGFVDLTSDDQQKPLTVHWQAEPPHCAGVWWWRAHGTHEARLATVLDFGGRLSVREKLPDGKRWFLVTHLTHRDWAGPIPTPDDLPLEAFG